MLQADIVFGGVCLPLHLSVRTESRKATEQKLMLLGRKTNHGEQLEVVESL